MFNQEEFEKNQFIKEKINYECLAGKVADKIIHIAFNINDAFFMQMGVTVTSVLENNPDKAFAIHIFCDGVSKENLTKTRQLAEKYQRDGVLRTRAPEEDSGDAAKGNEADRRRSGDIFRRSAAPVGRNEYEEIT